MPEENFEEGARRKAEEFGMEPNADVWLRVQAAIKPERRRKALLWWWLLPLCLAGIAGGWLLKRSGEAPERVGTVAIVAQARGEEPLSVEEPATAKTKRLTGHVKDTADGNELKKKSDGTINNRIEKHRIRKVPAEEWKNPYSSNKKKKVVQPEDDSGAETNQQPSDATANVMEKKAEESTLLPKENENIWQVNRGNSQPPLNADSTGNHNKGMPVTVITKKDSASMKPDVSKALEQKKKTNKKKWQMGIVTEVGLTSWGKELLTKEVETTNKYAAIPDNSSATLDSLKAATSESQRTKNGIDVGAGFIARKEIAHHFYISGQLGYRYQQYQVYNLRTSTGNFQNLNADYLVNKNIYHSHFISLCTGAGKSLFSGQHNALSVEAGLDNSFLMTNGRQNIRQTALDAIGGNRFTKTDFYRWQPQLFLSLPFSWHAAEKVKFAVSPFARVGLHSYQKNSAGYGSNHLMSAGVQAVYFFR